MKHSLELNPKQEELLEFVKVKHGAQKRKYTDEPYWVHPLEVARIVDEFVKVPCAVEIALCHDLLEDTDCVSMDIVDKLIELEYSEDKAKTIRNGVISLTDVYTAETFPDLNREKRKHQEAVRLGNRQPLIQSIKYADLIDNTTSIVDHDPGFARVYLHEKLQLINRMREGNIHLLIKLCVTYDTALKKLKD